jgi:hypothetical protein
VHEPDVELGTRIALLGKRIEPPQRGRVVAAVGSSDGIVELRCRRGTCEAENQNEACESSGDHARPMRPENTMMESPHDTIKTATV